jgi:2-polyprenyl-3-methyl-5-hydroxy-6-metoxy-1,4-benzoquinol methylase
MSRSLRGVCLVACLIGCRSEGLTTGADETKSPVAEAGSRTRTPSRADPELKRDQDEYVEDAMAFANLTRAQVRRRMKQGANPLKDEWNAWEKDGPMTPERITAFYKQTTNYIYELGEWHLFVPDKRHSDLALFDQLRAKQPRNILDFGGGTGLLALPLARAGLDVTLADLDSTTLNFALFRAKRRGVRLKVWKSDVEPAPPDPKYDVIMCMDVLEHLPRDILHDVVDKLIKLKHARTEIIIAAPFGRTAVHPMHMDLSADTREQIQRLRTVLPDDAATDRTGSNAQ